MSWQIINVILTLSVAGISLGFAGFAWQRRHNAGGKSFALMCFCFSHYALFYAFELASSHLSEVITWSKIQYLGLTLIPLAWLVTALQFSGNTQWLTRPILGLLAMIPFITIGLAFTNEWHGLIWAESHLDTTGAFPIFTAQYGAAFWIYFGYANLLYILGSLVLWQVATRYWALHRQQATALLLGTAIPWLGNIFAIFDFYPIPQVDTGPVSFLIGLVILGWAMLRFQLLDITPIAYRLIVDNIPDGIMVLDGANRVVLFNKAMLPYTSNHSSKVIGKMPDKAFPALKEAFTLHQETLGTQTELNLGKVTLELRGLPLHDDQGHLRGRICIFSNITQRKEAERARQEEVIFNRALIAAAALLNSSLDPQMVMQGLLEAVSSVVPHDFASMILMEEDGTTARVQHHRNFPPEIARTIEQQVFDTTQVGNFHAMLQTGKPYIIADTATYPDWQNKAILHLIRSTLSAPIRLDKQVIGFINLDSRQPNTFTDQNAERLQVFANQAASAIHNARLYDQTRRQKDELDQRVEQLTLVQRVYRELNELHDIEQLLLLAMDTAVRLSNARSAVIALAEEEVLRVVQRYGEYNKHPVDEIITPKSGVVGRVMTNHKPELILDVFTDPDYIPLVPHTKAQMVIPLLIHKRLIGLIDLETHRPSDFSSDSFQLLQLLAGQLAVAIENARLNTRLQAQLVEQQQLYEKVSQLGQIKSDMIHIAAHDLGNPLGVVRGFIELMRDEPDKLDPTFLEYLASMDNSVARMNQIIKDILSLERIERMAQADTATNFDMLERVEAALDEYIPKMQAKKQLWRLEVEENATFYVIGDPIQIYEALTNLIGNATKYTPGGVITIKLRHHNADLNFEVADTGYGIPEELQERLFQPFYRAKTQETRTIEGTGLGLHLVKNIIQRHGGEMIFRSVYGQGSTFGFSIPASPIG